MSSTENVEKRKFWFVSKFSFVVNYFVENLSMHYTHIYLVSYFHDQCSHLQHINPYVSCIIKQMYVIKTFQKENMKNYEIIYLRMKFFLQKDSIKGQLSLTK